MPVILAVAGLLSVVAAVALPLAAIVGWHVALAGAVLVAAAVVLVALAVIAGSTSAWRPAAQKHVSSMTGAVASNGS